MPSTPLFVRCQLGSGGILEERAWLEFIIARDDSLHFLLLILAIEWRVAGKQEVGDDTHCPYVYWLPMARCQTVIPLAIVVHRESSTPHTLLENLGSHVTWSPTDLRE